MKTSTKLIAIAVIIGVIAFAAGMLKQDNRNEVTIGVISPLTGFGAEYGEEIRKGIEDALVGTDVRAIFEDEKCEPKDAVSAFHKLTEFDGVHYIIGPGCGSPQEAITPLLNGKETIVVVPSAASDSLYNKSGGNLFNIQYSLEDESKFLAEKMFELGNKKVVLIGFRNAFSEAHAASFRKNYKGSLVREIWFADNTVDVSTELAKLKGFDFDAIYSVDIAFYFAQGGAKLKQYGITKPVFTSYVAELPAVRELVEGVMYSFPGELPGDGKGAVYELSKEAATLMATTIEECDSQYVCVKRKFDSVFESGVKKRSIILKKIVNGVPVVF